MYQHIRSGQAAFKLPKYVGRVPGAHDFFLNHFSVCSLRLWRAWLRKICMGRRMTLFDVWNTHTLISFADTTTRITPYDVYPLPWIPTTGKSEKNLWLSRYAFVIPRLQNHRERSGVRVLLVSNQLSPVSNEACIQATQTLLGRTARTVYQCAIWSDC